MGTETEDPLAWLMACESIRQLASRYAVAMGQRDFDALAALFVPDVRVGELAGRAALAENFAAQLEPITTSILHVTNHVIDVASAEFATGTVGTRAELEIDGAWIVQMIQYGDEYRMADGKWCFVRRRHRLWYGAPVGTSPIGLPPADWPANTVGRGDLLEPAN